MVFGLGPVLRYELITTARRGRYYLLRAVYGLFLLWSLAGQFHAWEQRHPRGGTIQDLYWFAESAFVQFAGAQGLALLLLIPALVAGVIADDYQRKTLHYLLASRLSSAEIVLGKLGARLVHVGTFVALGLPVVCLLGLYGGLNPQTVLWVYLGTFAMVLCVAGGSVFISTLARRPRDAILVSYGLEAIWLLGPHLVAPIAHNLEGPLKGIGPIVDAMMVTNPMNFWGELAGISSYYRSGWPFAWAFPGFESRFFRMVETQAVIGLLFLGLAIAGLRPLRGSSWPGARPQTGWWTRLRGVVQGLARTRAATSIAQNPLLVTPSARPPCGDAPMLWKERYARMTGSLSWLSSRGVILFFSVFLGCFLFDVAYPALSELFGTSHSHGTQTAMNSALRQASVALSVLGMLAIAASSAVTLTGEREQDTWISLATTLLSPGEIIWAKQVGAVWSAWRIGLALLVVWATGILLGALHPTGVLVSATIVGLVAWFLAAVGVFVSGRVRNSTRSLAWTFLILILGLGHWPWMVGGSLGTYREVATPWSNQKLGVGNPWSEPANALIVWAVELALYAAAAGLLTWGSIRRLRATWGES